MLNDVSNDFTDFIKKTLKKDVKANVKIYPKEGMSDDIIGGVVLYCNQFKIVFDNSLRMRLNLSFEDSIPDLRKMIFKSLDLLIYLNSC